jgi:uncharacterized Zn finger protein
MKSRASVADLVDAAALKRLATPSNLRLGRAIAARGGVALLKFGPLRVTAKVSVAGGARRTVELDSTLRGLRWKCTCTRKPDLFCKHCVAAAIVTWRKAPARR